MKSDTVKTISIYLINQSKPKWIFDVSDKTAEKIMNDYESPAKSWEIQNVPTSKGNLMTLHINKDRVEYVSVE